MTEARRLHMNLFEARHENALADNDLLKLNDSSNDNFTIPRDVDFAFKTANRENAQDFCEYINGKNFGLAKFEEIKTELHILVVIHMPITQHLICSVSGFMLCLSRVFKIEYDGWGSVIQKSK
jgi:hypothetical protein